MQKRNKGRKTAGPRARGTAGPAADEFPADFEPKAGITDDDLMMSVTIGLPVELLARIDVECARTGVSTEAFIAGAVRDRLDGMCGEASALAGCAPERLIMELRRRGATGDITVPMRL